MTRTVICLPVALVLILMLPASLGAQDQKHRLTSLDGGTVEHVVTGWDDSGLQVAGITDAVDPLNFRRMERLGVRVEPQEAAHYLHFVTGEDMAVSSVTLHEGTIQATWKYGEFELPVELIKGITLRSAPEGVSPLLFETTLRERAVQSDQLFAIQPGAEGQPPRLVPVQGVVIGMTADQVSFEFRGEVRPVVRDRVLGIRLASAEANRTGIWTVLMADGSSLPVRGVALEGSKANLKIDASRQIEVPWREVVRIDIRSDRLVYLSDLTPVEVREDPLLDIPRPWQRDRNVRGGPLVIGSDRFDRGVGVRSYARLVYDIDRQFQTFAATIGIDASTRGLGDCEFVVLADGREIFRQRVRGTDEPRPITLSVDGVRRLAIVVEYGEDLSLSDIANWADARLLKEAIR